MAWEPVADDLPHISPHAASRALDMCLTPQEIIDLLRHGDRKPALHYGRHAGSVIISNGRIAAALSPEGFVTTFLWYRMASDPRFSRELDDEMKRIRDVSDGSAHHQGHA